MLFANKIRELRENKQMLQRHVSAALDMDNAMYCKIEKGDRRAKREQIPLIAGILQTDAEELLTLWLADNIMEVLEGEKELAEQTLKVVIEKINR
ncbi:MAG: helix-turn-helix transcriptional regulator [Rikenellaceae bacterium]